jgi:hypothetical protein
MNNNILNNIINIPNIIQTNKIYNYKGVIKSYEDTYAKIIGSVNNDPNYTNKMTYVWKISHPDVSHIFNLLTEFDAEKLCINIKNNEDIFITGPAIRYHVHKINKHDPNIFVPCWRNDVYIYNLGKKEWGDILDIKYFVLKNKDYIYKTSEFTIHLVNKQYNSIAHILLQNDYLKRVGWSNGEYYISSMFLLEYYQQVSDHDVNFRDPVYNYPVDVLDVYVEPNKNKNLLMLIDMIDIEGLHKINKSSFGNLYGGKTCMEYCIDKYVCEKNPIIKNQLKLILLMLNETKYFRDPQLYVKLYKNDDLNKLLITGTNYDNMCFKSVDDINNYYIELYVKEDNCSKLFDFINYFNIKVDNHIIQLIIKHKAKNLTLHIVKNAIIPLNNIYYLILMTQEIDLFGTIQPEFNIDIALNYYKDVLENCLIRSFYFMFCCDESIINVSFGGKQNILFQVTSKNTEYVYDFITLILKLKPELVAHSDANNKTILIHAAEHDNELLNILLDFDAEYNYLQQDNLGNTFVHYICMNKSDNVDLFKKCINKVPEILNLPNNNYETFAIQSCMYKCEDIFYTLKGMGADLKSVDKFGNSVYHYICKNAICIGILCSNKKNNFGITPKQYCSIAPCHYEFK